jgi:hypothetical protein
MIYVKGFFYVLLIGGIAVVAILCIGGLLAWLSEKSKIARYLINAVLVAIAAIVIIGYIVALAALGAETLK